MDSNNWYYQYLNDEKLHYLTEVHPEDGILGELFFETTQEFLDYVKEHEIKYEAEPILSNITHGIIVVDPESYDEENDMLEIVHFVGFWTEPSEKDAWSLRKELEMDEEFELTEIIDRCEILPAPIEIVEYWRDIEDGE